MDLPGLDAAIAAGADIVLLDNMDDAAMAEAVRRAAGRVLLEASGNMTLERLPRVAATGVDFVSMGAITHSARAVDISFELRVARTLAGSMTRADAEPSSSEELVLAFLAEAGDEFVSGEAISDKLGLTRAAVWKHVEALRGQGYRIEAVPARGYRLAGVPDRLTAARAAAAPQHPRPRPGAALLRGARLDERPREGARRGGRRARRGGRRRGADRRARPARPRVGLARAQEPLLLGRPAARSCRPPAPPS